MSQENLALGCPTMSDTNLTVQPQTMTRTLKFLIEEVEILYHLCSKNKGSDQLHTYHAANLQRFFFRICKRQVFS